MSTDRDPERLVRRLAGDVWNDGQTGALSDLLASSFVGHGYGHGGDLDREAYVAFVEDHRAKLPDLELTLDDVVADGDRVAVRWTRSGTPAEPLMGVEADGPISVPGSTVYRVEDGRIAEAWTVRDTAVLLKQLGLFPPGRRS
jgi:steroid delta-isomerase-like uncharacterized protein